MTTGIIIQARLTSKRFPRKVFASRNGKTVLEIIHQRLEILDLPIVFAIPDNDENLELRDYLLSKNYNVFCGSETNVIDRFILCAEKWHFNHIIRVCADSPFIRSDDVLDNCKKYFYENEQRMIWGLGSWVFSLNMLRETQLRTKRDIHIEHVITDMQNTIDYPEDLLKLGFSDEFI